MARPRKQITAEAVERIVAATRDGLPLSAAGAKARRPRSTVRGWLDAGRRLLEEGREPGELDQLDQLCLDLYTRWSAAQADLQAELVQVIKEASKKGARGDWRAASFILERRFQRDWCLKVAEGVADELSRALELLREGLTPEEFSRVRRILARSTRQR